VLAVIGGGALVLAHSSAYLWAGWPPVQWWLLAALTLLSGSAALKIPAVPVNFSISDVFTLTTAVMFGPSAATLVVVIDSLMISARLMRTGLPLERVLFNAAAPAAAMWVSAHVFFLASGIEPLQRSPAGPEVVVPWLLPFAALYFLVNTFAIAVAIGLHERAPVLQIWRAHFQGLWVTFLGGAVGAACVVFALQLGTYGQMMLALPLVLAAILHFAYRNATGRVADQLHHLAEVNRLHLSTIEALAHAIDAKDAVTHGHIRRVQAWAIDLAFRIGIEDDREIRAIEAAALLHDIGKLAIPEHILNKPGRLTPSEFERMKSHACVGAEILSEIEFPYPVVPIVRHHHENWDGSGYPDGLAGEAIPIGARILAVVDCFDALTSDRPYRRALPAPQALAIVEARVGTMYDPAIVAAFRNSLSETMPSAAGVDTRAAAIVPAAPAGVGGRAERDRDDLEMALRIGAAIGTVRERPAVWRALAEALRQALGASAAVVFAVHDAQQEIRPLSVTGGGAGELAGLVIPIGERLSGWALAHEQPMVNADAALDLFDVTVAGLTTALAVPCSLADGRRFVVTLYSHEPGRFGRESPALVRASLRFANGAGQPGSALEPVGSIGRIRRPTWPPDSSSP
jgi:putative nucleotidyltransferase with HDIG domain